jgi:hypothetical protein
MVLAACISWIQGPALMMKVASTSETSVKFYQCAMRNDTQERHLHSRRLENLRSHNHNPIISIPVFLFRYILTISAANCDICLHVRQPKKLKY